MRASKESAVNANGEQCLVSSTPSANWSFKLGGYSDLVEPPKHTYIYIYVHMLFIYIHIHIYIYIYTYIYIYMLAPPVIYFLLFFACSWDCLLCGCFQFPEICSSTWAALLSIHLTPHLVYNWASLCSIELLYTTHIEKADSLSEWRLLSVL